MIKLNSFVTAAAVVMISATASLADLALPNGKTVFSGFDNAAPGDTHPSLDKRSDQARESSKGNAGAWEAHINSDKIDCNDCGG